MTNKEKTDTNKCICKNCWYSSKCNRVTTGLVCGVNEKDGICSQCGQSIKNKTIYLPVDKNHTCEKFVTIESHFASKLIDNMKDLEPEYAEIVNNHYKELLWKDENTPESKEEKIPIGRHEFSARDWTEDFVHENGNYLCKCYKCGQHFYGHKRRTRCKICSTFAEIVNNHYKELLWKRYTEK